MFPPPQREKEARRLHKCMCMHCRLLGPAGLIIEGSDERINVSIGFISSHRVGPLTRACLNIYVCALWVNANWVTCLVPLQAFWLSESDALFYSTRWINISPLTLSPAQERHSWWKNVFVLMHGTPLDISALSVPQQWLFVWKRTSALNSPLSHFNLHQQLLTKLILLRLKCFHVDFVHAI